MAHKLKFGNGTWATKEGSTLAYNDQGGNFKPLPFTTTRNSIATRVNKEGLIEVVGNDIPRIDYTDSTDGVFLLENSATNFITYSEDFSDAYWNKFDSSVTSGFVSPDGSTNAFKLIEGNTNTQHGLLRSNFPINVQRTLSVFVKKGENERFFISDYNKFGYTIGVIFNLTSGTIESNQNDSIYLNPKIEPYLNGWYKCSVTWTNTTGLTVPFFGNAILGTNSYQGDGVSGLYVFGAQFEEASYSTSYIPTQGSAVTRLADACSQTPPNGVIGQTEGTMYAEIDFKSKPEAGSPIVGIMTLNNNVNNLQNCIILGIERQSGGINRFYPFVQVGNSTVAYITGGTLTDGNYKVAFAYKQNDFILYVNGVQIGTDTNGAVPTTSQVLVGERYNGDTSKIADGIKETKLYNTRLTNAELAALTTI